MKVLEKFKSSQLLFINQRENKPPNIKFKVPKDTDDIWDIKNIIVPDYLRNSHPSPKKVTTYTNACKELGCLDKPLTVTKDTSYPNSPFVILTDGYIRWIIADRAGYKKVPIRWDR